MTVVTQRVGSSIALLFHDRGTRKWVSGQQHAPAALYPRGKDPVTILEEAGWAQGSVWTGAENLVLTGFRCQDHPTRSQPLYRLRYPAHKDFKRYLHIFRFTLSVFNNFQHLET